VKERHSDGFVGQSRTGKAIVMPSHNHVEREAVRSGYGMAGRLAQQKGRAREVARSRSSRFPAYQCSAALPVRLTRINRQERQAILDPFFPVERAIGRQPCAALREQNKDRNESLALLREVDKI
jgi:hypothetical protein